jgi:ATP-dependent helicase/nuclease subunit A
LHFLGGLEDEGDIGMPAVAGHAANAVRVMSIHKSKGLEFPIVILPDLGKGFNLRDADTKLVVDDCVGIAARVVDLDKEVHYASIGAVLAQAEVRRKALAEELRVLYVAATRAKEHLILVGTARLGAIEAVDAEWSSHRGPIDAGDVLAAGCMLDWVLPASSVVEATAPGSFGRAEHAAADVEAWADALLVRRPPDGAAELIARLKPLLGPPVPDAAAQGAIDRLSFAYPFEKMTGEPAAASVTSLTKRGKTFVVGDPRGRQIEKALAPSLHLPRCVEQTGRRRPEDVGAATHALLQRLDFGRAGSIDDLKRQALRLVEKRFIRPDLVNAIDYEGVAWLLDTDLGRRLRTAKPGELMREVDVVYAAPRDDNAASDDPRGSRHGPRPARRDAHYTGRRPRHRLQDRPRLGRRGRRAHAGVRRPDCRVRRGGASRRQGAGRRGYAGLRNAAGASHDRYDPRGGRLNSPCRTPTDPLRPCRTSSNASAASAACSSNGPRIFLCRSCPLTSPPARASTSWPSCRRPA